MKSLRKRPRGISNGFFILNLPPIVLECPECGEKYLISNESNLPSEKVTLFSDGFYIDEQIWRTPGIIGCVTCELGFFLHNGKIIASPDWDEYYQKYGHIKKAVVNRNLYRFEMCLSLLEGALGGLPDAIRQEASEGNNSVIQI